jgi:uncharacterized membrane protein
VRDAAASGERLTFRSFPGIDPEHAMSAIEPVPSSREFTFVGVAYGLHVTGLFLFWPALIGLVLDYVKRGDVEGTVLESHYGWLIRTFWWSLLWASLVLGAMLAVIIPEAVQVAGLARSGNYLSIPWSFIGAAVLGGIGLSVVWFWAAYRFTRGILRLSSGQAVP